MMRSIEVKPMRKLTVVLPVVMILMVVMMVAPGATQAATIRGHSTHGSSGSHGGGGGGSWGHHWHGGFGLGFYSSYYYLPSYYPYGGWYPGYYPAYLPDVAYIDCDVSPEGAAVYLDGEYVGVADDYDGFPQYLTVSPGRHQITFKSDDHRSVTRNVRVPRGAVLDLEFTIPSGSSRDEGRSWNRRDEPRDRGGARGDRDDDEIVVPDYQQRGDDSDDDRDDVSIRRDKDPDDGEADEPEHRRPEGAEPAFIRMSVSPADASVYLDGQLYGSAERLSRLHGELRVDSGSHRIEVVRPGYRSIRRDVEIRPGQHLSLDFDLQRSAPRPGSVR